MLYPIRSCIVGCYTTEDYFLAKQGAFLLLDLLTVSSQFVGCKMSHFVIILKIVRRIRGPCCQSSPRCVHGVVLTALLELCDNPNTVSHLLSWRDQGGQTAPRLLLQLWRDEEEELGVSRDRRGVITGLQLDINQH